MKHFSKCEAKLLYREIYVTSHYGVNDCVTLTRCTRISEFDAHPSKGLQDVG